MSKLFESNWDTTRAALCEGLEGTKKQVMETVLNNTRRELQLMESATAGATASATAATTRATEPQLQRYKQHLLRASGARRRGPFASTSVQSPALQRSFPRQSRHWANEIVIVLYAPDSSVKTGELV